MILYTSGATHLLYIFIFVVLKLVQVRSSEWLLVVLTMLVVVVVSEYRSCYCTVATLMWAATATGVWWRRLCTGFGPCEVCPVGIWPWTLQMLRALGEKHFIFLVLRQFILNN